MTYGPGYRPIRLPDRPTGTLGGAPVAENDIFVGEDGGPLVLENHDDIQAEGNQ